MPKKKAINVTYNRYASDGLYNFDCPYCKVTNYDVEADVDKTATLVSESYSIMCGACDKSASIEMDKITRYKIPGYNVYKLRMSVDVLVVGENMEEAYDNANLCKVEIVENAAPRVITLGEVRSIKDSLPGYGKDDIPYSAGKFVEKYGKDVPLRMLLDE